MEPGEVYLLEFELFPTSNLFRAGHRIRVDISSSNFPRFDVNPNTGGPLGLDRSYVTAMQSIYHDSERPSCIVLSLQPPTDPPPQPTFSGYLDAPPGPLWTGQRSIMWARQSSAGNTRAPHVLLVEQLVPTQVRL